jgi:hypothetical protein
MADLGPCSACGAPESGIALNNRPFCDRCADQRLAAVTDWPTLPAPQPAEVIIGPDRRRHFVRYRMLRMPGAVLALAEELGGGYRLELRCDHFEDPSALVERIRTETRAAIAHPYLALNTRLGRTIAGDVVAGRLEEADQDDPELPDDGPQIFVDGQGMSWTEFGDLLKLYHGWSFELRLGGDPPSRVGSDPLERITARAPAAAEKRAAVRALRASEGAYVLDSTHYPTPDQWAQRDRA